MVEAERGIEIRRVLEKSGLSDNLSPEVRDWVWRNLPFLWQVGFFDNISDVVEKLYRDSYEEAKTGNTTAQLELESAEFLTQEALRKPLSNVDREFLSRMIETIIPVL